MLNTVEEDLNNQWTESASFSSHRGGEVVHGLSNVDAHSPRLTWRGHCQVPNLPQQRPTLSAPHGAILQDDQLAPGGRLMTMDHFDLGRAAFCPYCGRHLLWYRLAFCVPSASVTTTAHGLTECLTYSCGISHGTASDQGTHSTAQCGSGPLTMGFADLATFPPS